MKIFYRTLLILVAAAIVSGAAVAFASSSATQSNLRGFDGRREQRFGENNGRGFPNAAPPQGTLQNGTFPNGNFEQNNFPRGEFGRRGGRDGANFNFFAAGELIKNIVIMSVIVAAFVIGSLFWRAVRHSKPHPKPL